MDLILSGSLPWLSMLIQHRLQEPEPDTDSDDLAKVRKWKQCEEEKKERLKAERTELERKRVQILREIEENSRASERADVALQIAKDISEILTSGKN